MRARYPAQVKQAVLVVVVVVGAVAAACASPGSGGASRDAPGSDATSPSDRRDTAADGATRANVFVYGAVPGLAPSDHYAIRVRPAGGSDADWQGAFAWVTASPVSNGSDAFWPILDGWSNTYANFETDGAVEVELARVDGTPISTAAAHPARKVSSVSVFDGKAYVVIANSSQIAVDVDGQMDAHDTGLGSAGPYEGPPIDTVTLFANPILDPRPDPMAPGTYAVQPGETPPSTGDWQTLYFLPGVHDIGLAFPVHAGKTYIIPGDAMVYGTLYQNDGSDGHDIHIAGYGTLSGERLTHPKYVMPPPADFNSYDAVYINGALGTSIVGLTVANSAYHAVITPAALTPTRPTDFQWVKILGWRKNGDGINPFANGRIEDSFIRTQDDGSYVNGRGTSRVVFWTDANGSSFVLSALPNTPVVVDDIDVIYARAAYNKWAGGRIFNMRGLGGGAAGAGVVFSNVRLEDTRPTLQAFFIAMTDDPPYLSGQSRAAGALGGVTFDNISLAASSVLGEPDILWGSQIAPIQNLTFDALTIAGTPVLDASHFTTNEYVSGLAFSATP